MRRVAEQMTFLQGDIHWTYFGPFTAGDFISACHLYFSSSNSQGVQVRVGMFAQPDVAAFEPVEVMMPAPVIIDTGNGGLHPLPISERVRSLRYLGVEIATNGAIEVGIWLDVHRKGA